MRIAFFVTSFPALSATFILNQVIGLIERGHAVDIYCDRPGGERDAHPDVERLEMAARTRSMNIAETGGARIAAALPRIAGGLMRHPRATLAALNPGRYGDTARSLNLLHTLAAARTMPTLREPYDIIHAHFGPLGVKAQFLRDHGLLRGPLVTSFYGYDLTRMAKQQQMHIYRDLFARGELLIPLCDYFQSLLVKHGCPETKTAVHHIGVDLDKFAYRPRAAPAPGEPVRLFSIARLVEKKGIEFAIRSVAQVHRAGAPVHYAIAGDGPLRADLERLIDSEDVRDAVTILGWQSNDDVAGHLARAHIFLAPSVTAADGDQEGTPTVIMEASATGLPIIATHHSGIPEIVRDGETGVLVAERDVEGLMAALHRLLDDPAARAAMGAAGRAHIDEHFNTDRLNDRLVGLYEQVA